MLLAGGKNYYYEILHVMGDVIQSDTLTLKCYVIGLKYIKPILILPAMIRDPAVLKEFLESSPASDLTPTEELLGNPNNTKSALNYTVDLEHLDSIALETVFSNCSYDPSYQQKRDYKKYEGATSGTYFTKTYPKDGSWISDCPASEGGFCLGNDVIDQGVVDEVIEMFMKSLEKAYPRKYSLEKIIGIEEKEDKQRGSRYLLELVLIDNPTKSKLRVLNYFFKFKNKSTLCIPARLALRMDTVINIVITVSAQKVWILHFIRDLAQVIRDSNDQNVNVIIAYYGNDPASLEYELKRKDIKNFTVIPLTGRFHKTYAIQKAVSSVRDKDSIVFLLDLHLRMPSNILESVRKHTIQGVLAYSPIVFRLSECAGPGTREHPSKGFFQKNGFGIFSIYKSDWDVFGGMNVKDFKHTWGGEDWDLADRVLNSGIEIERLMLPGFYHFFHSHSGMWDIS
ncbi:N-acetyl-beta-glucosaminyl-glycoprotein 4-beta-N-acetylgalactosaminyltransferase 1 isoform X1 [Nematostella vectensis]|uniref:N-acetyl-beta-glucosaminyl-glycoprotein 4-beta-N-acetylgalactosaminyltransferase 1 isoform X1 n=1 Tax=Nematostella vectensis TaxID=45351 RepID=UPI002077370A|nr:N-acetyl-beta-glucosaminyl-glycoprotein 4-beta-N-acetylgalactosaminyltransferase 1 isoform X1 [Nematostella vectensis]XP_032225834.2 N-acetyl-beta-glucosaminyl-glycoprotein 4-beta-N-acetylgalactosaminyltransferase 1 isoform X1 [Nematostella vectensis]XP_032225835.2 N-acetyl-beta-glucosaminyl-glycoprotein 4-beta-N-acetylgalactosaminyltransferase 1 isoform X1 [Nematostella vectensis]